ALVDVPVFWILVGLMFGVVLLFNRVCPLQASSLLTLIVCLLGYGVSLVLLIYIIAFKFRMGRSNRYIWSFIFILVNFTLYMFSDLEKALYLTFSILFPVFPLMGWL
ncbi:ABCA5 protein, partial [Hemiprocne comata]|nr:ABCA5 protein [Hemiprocne comata]